MWLETKKKFLFKCDTCQLILEIDLTDPKDLEELQEDKILLQCPCGGVCLPLRN
jgi:hypothetical protein